MTLKIVNRLPNMILRKVELLLKECRQLVDFPLIISSPL
jgi:hypothetical protein